MKKLVKVALASLLALALFVVSPAAHGNPEITAIEDPTNLCVLLDGNEPALPSTLTATVDGVEVEVDVTWQLLGDTPFSTTTEGTYSYQALVDVTYDISSDVNLPTIDIIVIANGNAKIGGCALCDH